MTNYHLQPPQHPFPYQEAWKQAKEERQKVLAEVRARRKELYQRMQNRRKAMKSGSI